MRIVLSEVAGGPETLVLREVPEPVAGSGEVVVAVHACSVNFPDALMVAGQYQFKPPRPFAPGLEVAGEIKSVGPDVTDLRPGDRVIALLSYGGMAERVATAAANCRRMPEGMSYAHGASFLATYGTAYHALEQRGCLRPGETLLVLGAGGGMGLACVELGRAMGARVIAAASSQEKVDLAMSLGASAGVIYPAAADDLESRKRLAGLFKEVAGDGGVDVVCDNVGGPYSEAALRSVAWGGRFLVIGFPAGIPAIPLNLPLLKGCQIVGVLYGLFAQKEPEANQANVERLMALYSAGKIRPHVSASYPLEQAGEAIAALVNRTAQGKVVVTPANR